MRIALLSDIHGNPLALDAVLADIEARGGVDGYWLLGDYSAIGYDPVSVLERLQTLPNAVIIRGNADRYVITGDRPPPTFDEVRTNPDTIPILAEVAGSFGWTQGYLDARGYLNWLAALPLEQRLTLPDGTRVLLTHAAPGTDDGWGLHPALNDNELRLEIGAADADLICVGHFHVPMDRTLDGVRMINPGAVSNNFAPDLRASYAILTATEQGHHFNFQRVPYDLDVVMACIRQSSNPGNPYLISFCRGEVRASWLKRWDGKQHLPPVTP